MPLLAGHHRSASETLSAFGVNLFLFCFYSECLIVPSRLYITSISEERVKVNQFHVQISGANPFPSGIFV